MLRCERYWRKNAWAASLVQNRKLCGHRLLIRDLILATPTVDIGYNFVKHGKKAAKMWIFSSATPALETNCCYELDVRGVC